ncbi:hypothetical protein THRCLA_03845 [Thraustotheca clavata]|uniref:Transmembrane protein n=1 Tax=Thraustotheca clavata TaxID=74557 RepID=A0A1W0A0R3_9STRA|nr:hypothetical protein THRCLA_03845 [Thraustotheca clavata]
MSVQRRGTNSNDKIMVLPVDAPKKVKSQYWYCDASECCFQWDKEAIDGDVCIVRHPILQLPHYFCKSCYDKYHAMLYLQRPYQLCNALNLCGVSRSDRLRSYELFIANGKKYFAPMLVIVLFLPLIAIIQSTPLRNRLIKITKLWNHIPKGQTFLSFVSVYVNFLAIVSSYPFTSQVVFWALLELYTVIFVCLNILFRTPINNFVNVFDQFKTNRIENKLVIALYRGFGLHIIPGCGLLEIFQLIQTSANTCIVPSAAAKNSIDLNQLHFVDSKTKDPLPSSLLGGVFASRSIAFNGAIMISWVTNVAPGVDFLFPSAYALISSPTNSFYNITGMAPSQLCNAASDSNGTQWTALWNMNIDPPPTATLGLPQLNLEFRLGTLLVPYTINSVWNINIVNQTGADVALNPIDGQSAFSFLGTFRNISSCSNVTDKLIIQTSISYPNPSIQQYIRTGTTHWSIFTIYLCFKHWAQFVMLALALANLTTRLWRLWSHFDGITDIGLFESHTADNSIKVDLGIFSNLRSWLQLRKAIVTASDQFAFFVQGIISLSLVQLAISFGGLVVYCLTGTAPMPTYFLLIIGLVMSLTTLIFLFPKSEAIQIQASHGDMLRQVLSEHLLDKDLTTDSQLENYLKTFIEIIDNHDDRISFWGFEMSRERLQGLCVTLISGISFIASKTIQFSWSNTNTFYANNPNHYIF